MNNKHNKALRFIGVGVLVGLLGFTSGCRRPRGLPSAAESGTKAVDRDGQPSTTETAPTTGTDATNRPAGPSGGATGSDPGGAQREGAGGGTTASTAADQPASGSEKK